MKLLVPIYAFLCLLPIFLQATSSIPYSGSFPQRVKISMVPRTFLSPSPKAMAQLIGPLLVQLNSMYEMDATSLSLEDKVPTASSRLFIDHSNLILKVSVGLNDGEGMRPLLPDQPITATPPRPCGGICPDCRIRCPRFDHQGYAIRRCPFRP